jgi:hypothetical protein
MVKDELGPERDEWAAVRCRQCGEILRVHLREQRPDGPLSCDDCIRRTVNRETERQWYLDDAFVDVVTVWRGEA